MRAAGAPDVFIVLNGPQDGTEFPVGAPSIRIGQDNGCMVNLQLDQSVQPIHAIATAMGKGYSIRAHTGVPVHVEGKKATRFKSRVIRPGAIMRVGHTDLMLECSPDGMSGRSHGIPLQNDFTWVAKSIFTSGFRVVEQLGRLVLLIPKYAWKHKFISLIVLVIASRYVPGMSDVVGQIVRQIRSFIAEVFQQ